MFNNMTFCSTDFNVLVLCFGQIKTLPDPYGDCDNNNNATVSECRLACVTRTVVEMCGCHDVYMTPTDNATCESSAVTIRFSWPRNLSTKIVLCVIDMFSQVLFEATSDF